MNIMHKYALPPHAECYRTLGPWTESVIPEGLKGAHQLKAGSWAVIRILSGAIDFAWDEESDGPIFTVTSGEELVVPPVLRHHLVVTGPVELTLSFHREDAAT